MDTENLAQSIVAILTPLMPYLIKLGEKAVEETGKKIGGDTWEQAKALWGKLRSKIEAKPAAQEATQDVTQTSGNENACAALRLQLKKLLSEDKTLAEEVSKLLEKSKTITSSAIIQQQAGNNAIQIVQADDVVIGQKNHKR